MKRLVMPVVLILLVAMLISCAPAAPAPAPAAQPAPAAEAPAPAAEPAPAPETPAPAPEAPAQEPEAPAPAEPAPAADPSLEDIKAKGYFILGLDDAFPPMGFRDENNEIVGFDIDLAREAAKRLGVEVQLHPLVWEFIAEELNGKRVDVIWNGCTITDERKEKFAFTEPYMYSQQVVVVPKGSPIKTFDDLAGKRAGIQGGSSANIALDSHPEVRDALSKLNSYSDNAKALADLLTGRLDAVFVDVTVFGEYRMQHPDDFEMLEQALGAEEFGIGVRKEDVSFREALQKALDECMADGTTLEIAKKWFGENAANVLKK